MSLVAVHRQALPACAWFDHWCGVWSTDDHYWQQAYQASNLGHSMCSKWTLTHRNCLHQCRFFICMGVLHGEDVMNEVFGCSSDKFTTQKSWFLGLYLFKLAGRDRRGLHSGWESLCGIERCKWWAVLSCWVQGSDDLITDDSLLQIWTGWARVISVYHQIVLQRSGRCIIGIWHHQVQFHTGSLYFIVSMVASCFWGQIVGTITYEK